MNYLNYSLLSNLMDKPESSKPIVEILRPESYLALIRNSVGSTTWRQMYASVNGREQDIMNNGDLSCAFFVSSILKMCDLLPQLSVTVFGLIRNLEALRWQKVSEAMPGDILVWETIIDEKGDKHSHIGFYLGEEQAVSNSANTQTIQQHHWTFEGQRPLTAIYRPLWEPADS